MPISASINAASNVTNTLINQAFAEHNRKRNFYWNEKVADAADQRQRAQYKDLYSPQAMMKQYQAAGLSPSMMMSGSAPAVGQSSAQGNMSGGLQGPYPDGQLIDPLAAAQMANIWADTKKKEVETENISEDTDLKAQMILNIVADTKNKNVEHRLLTAQSELAEINAEEGAMTLQTNIERAYHNTSKAAAEARSAIAKADLDEAIFHVSYELAYANLEKTITETKLLDSEIGVNKAQIKEIAERIRNSQWQTWTMEKEQNRKDAIFNFDKAKFESEVKMWAREQNIELTKAKLDMVSDLVGYICNFATCGLSNITKLKQTDMYTQAQKDIANKPKTSHTQNYTIDKKGNKIIRSGKYQKTE